MPARKSNPTPKVVTKLAKVRLREGYTQADMARWIGISLRHYRRVERGESERARGAPRQPSLSILINAALAMRVPFEEIAPAGWQKTWTRFDGGSPKGPPTKLELELCRKDWADTRRGRKSD